MSDTDFHNDVFDQLDQEIDIDSMFANKRIAVRYRRSDIKAVIKIRSFLFPRLIPVILTDISSKGAAIKSNKPLKTHRKICLYLLFQDGAKFAINGNIAHSEAAPRYGVKFDRYHTELADHLLNSQTDLHFG